MCPYNKDCTKEENWQVAQDTYLAITTLGRYDVNGVPTENGEYVTVDGVSYVKLSEQIKHSRTDAQNGTYVYTEDNALGTYIKIAKGTNAKAIKHYSWSNSVNGIHMTITGGTDNSYTRTDFSSRSDIIDNSQWNHYYSRDGGITWLLYSRTNNRDPERNMHSYSVMNSEGTREILIKAVDKGVHINEVSTSSSTYYEKYYGEGHSLNVARSISNYTFSDTSSYDLALYKHDQDYTSAVNRGDLDGKDVDYIKTFDRPRYTALNEVGWNVSDAATNDVATANKISLLIKGQPAADSGYTYYRDKQIAYLDRTKPVISFGADNGEELYAFEYGCTTANLCSKGYTEKYANAIDSYVNSATSKETPTSSFDKNNSIYINHEMFEGEDKYQGDYTTITKENLVVELKSSGLGDDQYAMNGQTSGQDIRNVYRKYVIYEFSGETRTQYILSNKIPTTNVNSDDDTDYETAEQNIYNVIPDSLAGYSGSDKTYTIIYSVIDKAGNESLYIARGVLIVNLVPTIEVQSLNNDVEEVSDNTYYLSVEQGDTVEDIVNNLTVEAGNYKTYITQSVYYNGQLVVDNKRYDKKIYEGLTTSVPGTYEIIYNLKYRYYGDNGESEMISAEPVKLIIEVEETIPIVNSSNSNMNYTNIILAITLLAGAIVVGLLSMLNKKRN